jgi:hypothetical protein
MIMEGASTLTRESRNQRRFQMNGSSDSTAALAAANSARWRRYLPEDCVSAMVNAGCQWSM